MSNGMHFGFLESIFFVLENKLEVTARIFCRMENKLAASENKYQYAFNYAARFVNLSNKQRKKPQDHLDPAATYNIFPSKHLFPQHLPTHLPSILYSLTP